MTNMETIDAFHPIRTCLLMMLKPRRSRKINSQQRDLGKIQHKKNQRILTP